MSLLAASRVVRAGLFRNTAPALSSKTGSGIPILWTVTADRPWYIEQAIEYEVMPRDEYGVPAFIPPDISTAIKHTLFVPPQYYPFCKRIAEDTPELKPFMDKLIKGQMTWNNFEEMFYRETRPLKIFRNRFPMPWRTDDEIAHSDMVKWGNKWWQFRMRVIKEYGSKYVFREFVPAVLVGLCACKVWMDMVINNREDMKLFYIEAPECKINWIVPRGDL